VAEGEREGASGTDGEPRRSGRPPTPPAIGPRPSTEEIRNISFHTGVRGYDRRDVDRYVQRVNRIIAELEIASSPESAVRHALDRVGEQTSGILQRARETADEIVRTALSEADETIMRGRAEAEEIIADARAEADRIGAQAEADGRARIEQGERRRQTLESQGEQARAEAAEQLARAKSEANEIVARATKDAEEIIARADTQAVEHRAREEQRVEELRLQAEDELRALRAEINAVEAERDRILDEVHELAVRLDGLVDSGRPSPQLDAAPAADEVATGNGSPDAALQGDVRET
jgi:DivIVA domain-containing protein